MSNALKIIEALGRHEDSEAISVLRDLGTNSPRDDVREETAKALIRRNSEESLRIVVSDAGKGINDLNTKGSKDSMHQGPSKPSISAQAASQSWA